MDYSKYKDTIESNFKLNSSEIEYTFIENMTSFLNIYNIFAYMDK